MPLYKRLPEWVEATRWHKPGDHLAVYERVDSDGTKVNAIDAVAEPRDEMPRLFVSLRVHPGDWILMSGKAGAMVPFVMSHAEFADRYDLTPARPMVANEVAQVLRDIEYLGRTDWEWKLVGRDDRLAFGAAGWELVIGEATARAVAEKHSRGPATPPPEPKSSPPVPEYPPAWTSPGSFAGRVDAELRRLGVVGVKARPAAGGAWLEGEGDGQQIDFYLNYDPEAEKLRRAKGGAS